MRHLHFDVLGGASGDMVLAALIGLGADPERLRAGLASLSVEPVEVRIESAADRGIHGTRVTVITPENQPAAGHDGHDDHHHHQLPHRHLADIEAILQASGLPDPVQALSRQVFQAIAGAEARVHSTTIDQIHFHEVGALDSITDIVGACLARHGLEIDGVSVSPLPMGHGTIECAHGTYPNPAPATVELLKGRPVLAVDEPFELVTPTGAALLATWQTRATPPSGSRILRAAYAIGHRTLHHRPNVLRAILFEDGPQDVAPDQCLVLECNLDDTTPEIIGTLTGLLAEAGALDVFTVPAQMKKQRPGSVLTVLCRPEDRAPMLDLIFTESTTFGVRERLERRTVLARGLETVATPYGPVRVKTGQWQGRTVTRSPELEDCRRCAAQHGVPVRVVYLAAQTAAG